MATPEQIERVAAAMVAVRPGWSEASLVTYLSRHHAARPWRDLLVAGVIVAADERTQTPALMGQHGPWWLAAQAATGQATQDGQLGPLDARCARPGHEHELAHNCRACRSEAVGLMDQAAERARQPERTVPEPDQRVVHPDWRPTQAEIDMQATVAEVHRHVVEDVIPALAASIKADAPSRPSATPWSGQVSLRAIDP